MKSYPSSGEVRDGLGDKVVGAVAEAHRLTRADLTEYRKLRPAWVARASERGLASWLHDTFWYHLAGLLDGMPNVAVVDEEPTREIGVGLTYRIRVKRHHLDGHISTYPTQTALEFLAQPVQGVLDGMEQVHLSVGYDWDKELRDMGDPVISLRDGEEIIWVDPIYPPGGEAGGDGTLIPPINSPKAPIVDIEAARRRADSE